MKLSYREKIGLLIVVCLAMIIVFIAAPIRLIKANIKDHKEEKQTVQTEYNDVKDKIAEIPKIEKNIESAYEASKGLSADFTEHRENIAISKYIEELFNKDPYIKGGKPQLEVINKLEIKDATNDEIPFFYYTPNVVLYPIVEKADTNGTLLKDTDSALYEKSVKAVFMEELEAQEIEVRKVTVPVKCAKEALMALEDELRKNETGVRLTKVNLEDYTFGAEAEKPEDKGFSEGELELTFWTMQQIQKPDFSK